MKMGRWRLCGGIWSLLSISCSLTILISYSGTHAQDFMIPTTISVERHWSIPEDEVVGTRVATARVSDSDPSQRVHFSIESSEFSDGSSFFRIDPSTGAIFLNESMQGKKGKQFYVTIKAESAGSITSKIEVQVQVTPSLSSAKGPSFPPRKPGGSTNIYQRPTAYDGRPIGNIPIYPPGLGPPPFPTTPPIPSPSPSTPLPTTPREVTGVTSSLPPNEPIRESSPSPNDLYSFHSNEKGLLSSSTPPSIDPLNTNDLGESETWKERIVGNGTTGGTEDTTNYIVIFTIVPIVLLFGVVPIVVASIWLVRRRTRRVKKRPTKEMRKESGGTTNSSVTMSGEGVSPSALRQWIKQAQSNRYESWNPESGNSSTGQNRWEFPRHHLQVGRILGEGCFGQVWQCEALNIDGKEGVSTVAVKTLKEGAGERERADLLSELAVMKMLDPHPHVVRLLGACTEKDPTFLIMEYVSLGKLQSFLRNSRSSHYYPNLHGDSSSLSSKDLTAFCYQVARGMEYLASKGIIHRDLAARNILIDKERVCKVADFGFARDVVANHVYERKTDGRLPVRWMAPEALYDNIFTTKTDIWSFGVLMWEIVTLGSTPYPGMSAAEVMRKVREGYRLEKPDHCRRELYNIMFYCWAGNPDERPTFRDLVGFLKHLLFSETDYIELDRFPDHDYYNYMTNSTSGEKL